MIHITFDEETYQRVVQIISADAAQGQRYRAHRRRFVRQLKNKMQRWQDRRRWEVQEAMAPSAKDLRAIRIPLKSRSKMTGWKNSLSKSKTFIAEHVQKDIDIMVDVERGFEQRRKLRPPQLVTYS